MAAPRWTVEDDSLWYGPFGTAEHYDVFDVARYLNDPGLTGEYACQAYDALVQAVRDADTLTRARRLAKKPSKGGTFPADDATIWRLLNLLTEDPS